jgi:hypothetical protein
LTVTILIATVQAAYQRTWRQAMRAVQYEIGRACTTIGTRQPNTGAHR